MKEYRRMEGWVFQIEVGERMVIQYLEEGLYEALRDLQMREVGLIPEGFDVEEYTSLKRSLSRGSITECLNRGLDILVVEAKID